jgi:hypothetical protein
MHFHRMAARVKLPGMSPADSSDEEVSLAVAGAARAVDTLAGHFADMDQSWAELCDEKHGRELSHAALSQARDVLQRLQRLAGS